MEQAVDKQRVLHIILYTLHQICLSLIKAMRVWDEYTEGNRQRKLNGEMTRSLPEIPLILDKISRDSTGVEYD